MAYKILFHWDEEAEVWTATSDEIPGLALESGSFDKLAERLRTAVPEILDLNHMPAATELYITANMAQEVYA